MKAVIVGGGIGGLTAALALSHFGWDVEVLEQAPELGEIGAGLQISPNAMNVFEALDLSRALDEVAFRPEAIEIRMGMSGMDLLRMPLGERAIQRWGAPYLHIHRADLVAVLKQALSKQASASVQLGANVTGYKQSGQHAEAVLSDGRSVQGDLVIGADGIHSVIREQMLGPDAPTFTGNVAWRAVVPIEKLGPHAPNPVAGAWMGRGKHAVTYLLRRGDLANLVAVVERGDWTSESWSAEGSKEDALRDFTGWHPTITTLLEQSETLYRWALYDRPPLKRWTDGRVALLGDAAHPMLPFMAQGAAMAIEDAWVLAANLDRYESVSAGLETYQAERLPRATRIQARSRANARTFHQRGPAGRLINYGPMWIGGRTFPSLGLARLDPVYGHDVVKLSR
ncbi:MAG: FAD-dependent monooxygenase [Henriciella sp.]|nr:FAD-dependent monooxygenase [Henriciella sp.]